ncbi:MAG: hypothetical protein Q7S37_01845 [bacterium]|nr:hypothetical protein [bacterium]
MPNEDQTQDRCDCGMPLNDKTRCTCDSTKCIHCCECPAECECDCKSKAEADDEANDDSEEEKETEEPEE